MTGRRVIFAIGRIMVGAIELVLFALIVIYGWRDEETY